MSISDDFRNLAVDLLNTFEAMPVTLRRVTSTFNPISGNNVETNTDISTTTVITPETIATLDGKTVTNTIATLAAKGLSQEPKAEDFIITSSAKYRILEVTKVAPTGINIVFKCKLGDA